MTEEFISYLWLYRLFQKDIHLTDGREFKILNPGIRNFESGPDFLDARIQIGDILWVGNVEIHLKSSDWNRHHHQEDKSYDNVILHVVLDYDKDIFSTNGEIIPTFSIENVFDIHLWENFQQIIKGKGWIPCSGMIAKTDDFVMLSWLENMAADRLIKRVNEVEVLLQRTKNDWEKAFWIRLCRNFGFKSNAEPFEMLGRILPLNYLLKHTDNQLAVEAMIFGTAGMLNDDYEEEYPKSLKKEYEFYAKKFNLSQIEPHLWNFMRVYPVNFPTIRLAQISQLVCRGGASFSKISEINNIEDLKRLFSITASEYWNNHYRFGIISLGKPKTIGHEAIELVLINTVLPFIFSYGKLRGDDSYCERALMLLQKLPPENNHLIRNWQKIGVHAHNAMETQALLQLKQQYCSTAQCLQCRVGDYLLRLVN